MTFLKNLEEAAAPLLLDRQVSRKIVLGIFLSLVPVVSFVSLGYVLAVLQTRLEEKKPNQLPEWRHPEKLFLRGVVFFLVILTYSALPFLFTSASFAMLSLGFVFLPPALITLALSALLWMAAVAIMPMAMILFQKRGSAASVFDLSSIYRRILLILSSYFQATIVNLLLLALLSPPILIHPAGFLLSSPLLFLAMVYLANLYGNLCQEVYHRP